MNALVLLEVKNLKKSFMSGAGRKQKAQEAVKGISFSVAAGECAGLVGPSGCGKSTVARLVTGLIPPDEGSIFFRGQEILSCGIRCGKDVCQDMQMVFQSPADSFDPRQTLGWSIGEGMRNLGWERSRITERTERLLIEVGLNASYGRRYPHEVSGGEAQRAAIARALALEPKLLICDEVTSALDVTIQAQVIGMLRKIISGKGLSCLFITHDLALLPRIADRVLVMQDGLLVEEGTPQKLIHSPESSFTKTLMDADLFQTEADIYD